MRKTLRRGGACLVGLAASFVLAITGQAQPPDLDDLLDKAADYVAGYKQDSWGGGR